MTFLRTYLNIYPWTVKATNNLPWICHRIPFSDYCKFNRARTGFRQIFISLDFFDIYRIFPSTDIIFLTFVPFRRFSHFPVVLSYHIFRWLSHLQYFRWAKVHNCLYMTDFVQMPHPTMSELLEAIQLFFKFWYFSVSFWLFQNVSQILLWESILRILQAQCKIKKTFSWNSQIFFLSLILVRMRKQGLFPYVLPLFLINKSMILDEPLTQANVVPEVRLIFSFYCFSFNYHQFYKTFLNLIFLDILYFWI